MGYWFRRSPLPSSSAIYAVPDARHTTSSDSLHCLYESTAVPYNLQAGRKRIAKDYRITRECEWCQSAAVFAAIVAHSDVVVITMWRKKVMMASLVSDRVDNGPPTWMLGRNDVAVGVGAHFGNCDQRVAPRSYKL